MRLYFTILGLISTTFLFSYLLFAFIQGKTSPSEWAIGIAPLWVFLCISISFIVCIPVAVKHYMFMSAPPANPTPTRKAPVLKLFAGGKRK